nr:MAG TPA: hypothetical protein [Caudoviricetes sp.]
MVYRSIETVSNELFGSGKKKPELTDDIKKKIRDKYSRKPKSLQEEYKLFNEISHGEKTNKGPYTRYWQEFQNEWKKLKIDFPIPSDLKYVVLDHNGSLGFYDVRMPETLKGIIGDFDPEKHIGKDKYENKIKEVETKLGKGVVIAHDSEYTSLLYLSKKGLTELIFDRDFEKNDWLVPNDKINVGNHPTPVTLASVLAKYNVYVQVHMAFKQYKEGKLTLEHFNIGTTMTKFTLIPTLSEEAFEDMEKKANISTEFFGLFKKKPKEKPIDYKVESAIEDKIEEDFEYIDNINKICQVLEKEGLLKKDTSQQNKVKELKKQYPYLPNDYVYFVSNYGLSTIKNIDTYGTDIKLLDHFPKLSEKEELVNYVEDFNCQAYFKESIKDITAKEGEVVVIGEYADPDGFRYLGISKKGMFDISFDHRARIGWLSNDNFADYFEELSITYLLNSSLFYTQFAKLAELYKKGQLNISVEDIQPDSENIPTQEIVEASTKTDTDITDNPVESSTETKESTTTEDPVDEYMNDEIETSLIVLDVDSQTGNASDNATEETPTDSSTTSDSDGLDDTVQDSTDDTQDESTEKELEDETSSEDKTDDKSELEEEQSKDSEAKESESELEAESSSDDSSDKESELEEEKENFTADDLTNDKDEAKQVEEENPELDKKVENDTDEDATNTTTDSTDGTSDTSDGEDTEESSSEPTDTTPDDKPTSTQSETTEVEETEETTTETELNPAQEALYDLLEMRHALVHSSLSTEDYKAIRKHLGYVTLNYFREEAPQIKLLSLEEMTSPQQDLLHSVHTAIESLREKYQLSQVQYSFEDAATMTNEDITLSMEKITLGTFGKAFKNVFFNSGEPAYNSLAAINGIFFRAFGKAYWADPDKLKNRGAIEKKVNEILDQIDRDSEIHWAMIEKNIISTPQYIPISTKEEWDAIRSKVNTVKDKWKKKYDKKTLKAIKEKDSKKYKDLIRRSGAMSSILDVCRKLPKLKKK